MIEEQKYRIIEKLDSGGMAEVFIAESEAMKGFKKRVAIKRILPALTKNEKFIKMFLDEARLSLQLEHANIVSVFDIGRADSSFFIVMEYVDGVNLKKIIDIHRKKGRRLPLEQTLYVMREVCEGLSYAHDSTDLTTNKPLGIVHRDVSPPNILISRRGEIKLVDFGLAKATSQLESTDPGVVKGKFSYLSPEAASGLEVDRRADIFAVGILIYEMVTGQRLFYGENDYHTVELVRKAEVPSISQLVPDAPTRLEEILYKALAREPEERYQEASDLAGDLTRLLFTLGQAVSRSDISKLVDFTREQVQAEGPVITKTVSIIDALIQEEIVKFTSIDSDDDGPVSNIGAAPLRTDEISVMAPLDPGDFIDPRGWADDLSDITADVVGDTSLLDDEPPTTVHPAARMVSGELAEMEYDDVTRISAPPDMPEATRAKAEPAPAAKATPSQPTQAKKKKKRKGVPGIVWFLLFLLLAAAAVLGLVLAEVVKLPF